MELIINPESVHIEDKGFYYEKTGDRVKKVEVSLIDGFDIKPGMIFHVDTLEIIDSKCDSFYWFHLDHRFKKIEKDLEMGFNHFFSTSIPKKYFGQLNVKFKNNTDKDIRIYANEEIGSITYYTILHYRENHNDCDDTVKKD